MHEMALTQQVVDLVARRVPEQPVRTVRLEVGALAGVVPEAMRMCFDLATTGTWLEGAALEIVEIPGRLWCRSCGMEVPCPDHVRLCRCGSADVEVVAGTELRVSSVDVVEDSRAEDGEVQPCA